MGGRTVEGARDMILHRKIAYEIRRARDEHAWFMETSTQQSAAPHCEAGKSKHCRACRALMAAKDRAARADERQEADERAETDGRPAH